jgi:hypothetical protein
METVVELAASISSILVHPAGGVPVFDALSEAANANMMSFEETVG